MAFRFTVCSLPSLTSYEKKVLSSRSRKKMLLLCCSILSGFASTVERKGRERCFVWKRVSSTGRVAPSTPRQSDSVKLVAT